MSGPARERPRVVGNDADACERVVTVLAGNEGLGVT